MQAEKCITIAMQTVQHDMGILVHFRFSWSSSWNLLDLPIQK